MRRKIPSGSVFHKAYLDRKGRLCHTRVWYVKYYVQGRPITLPAGTEDKDEAVALLRQKMAQISQQAELTEHPERVRMGQLFDLLLSFYRTQERRSTYDVERKIERWLRPYFGKMKAQALASRNLERYVTWRQKKRKKRLANASINRELAYVRRAMRLGANQDPPLVLRVPQFQMLPEDNVREGILAHEKYIAIRDVLPRYARIALVVAYHTGARKGEIRSIRKEKIDSKAMRIYLPGRTTKNGKPRYLPIYGDMIPEIEMALSASDPRCPFLIQDEGKPVYDFEKAWATARESAGVPGTLFHDLRRTALTNMIEAGLSEKEAMEISGHKTRAVFDRYHIVSERRMRQNAQKLAEHLKAKEMESPETQPGSVN